MPRNTPAQGFCCSSHVRSSHATAAHGQTHLTLCRTCYGWEREPALLPASGWYWNGLGGGGIALSSGRFCSCLGLAFAPACVSNRACSAGGALGTCHGAGLHLWKHQAARYYSVKEQGGNGRLRSLERQPALCAQ